MARPQLLCLFLIAVLSINALGASKENSKSLCSNRLSLSDIRHAPSDEILRKWDISEDVLALDVDQSIKGFLLGFGNGLREVAHIVRLLETGRSIEERELALALIANYTLLINYIRPKPSHTANEVETTSTVARKTVAGEGPATIMWWTLSPYIFRELKLKRISDERAILALLQWPFAGMDDEPKLPGIILNRSFILNRDPMDATHAYARQEAKRVVKRVSKFADLKN